MAGPLKNHFSTAGGNQWATEMRFYQYGKPVGNVFFVSSTASTSSATGPGYSPEAAFTSVNAAIAACAADNGDVIVVEPGHVETLTAAASVALNVAGVTILGMGYGRQRPKFNYTTAVGASFDVTAARCRVENCVFTPIGFDNITAALNVQAADFSLVGCEMELANATNQAALGILTNASADRLRIEGCHIHGTTDAGTAAAIRIVGGTDIVIKDNAIIGVYTTSLGGIDQNTTTSVNPVVTGNFIANQTASATKAMVWSSSSNVFFANNRLFILSGTAPVTAAAGLNGGGNYYSAAAGVTAATLL